MTGLAKAVLLGLGVLLLWNGSAGLRDAVSVPGRDVAHVVSCADSLTGCRPAGMDWDSLSAPSWR